MVPDLDFVLADPHSSSLRAERTVDGHCHISGVSNSLGSISV